MKLTFKKLPIVAFLTVLFLAFLMPVKQADAQMFDYYRFEADTATNSETLTFTFPDEIETADSYQWVVDVSDLTGSRSTGVANLYSAAGIGSSASFVLIDTDSSDADTYFEGTAYGLQQQLQIVTTGTHTSEYKVYVVYKGTRE